MDELKYRVGTVCRQKPIFAGTVVKTGFYAVALPVFSSNHIEFYIIVAFIVFNHDKIDNIIPQFLIILYIKIINGFFYFPF